MYIHDASHMILVTLHVPHPAGIKVSPSVGVVAKLFSYIGGEPCYFS